MSLVVKSLELGESTLSAGGDEMLKCSRKLLDNAVYLNIVDQECL